MLLVWGISNLRIKANNAYQPLKATMSNRVL